MKYAVVYTPRFKKEFKKAIKRGLDVHLLEQVVSLLAEGKPLPAQHKDHPLKGNFTGFRECHIQSDWLLIYKIHQQEVVLSLERTGTHSDLFNE